jgi:hypothetical protein
MNPIDNLAYVLASLLEQGSIEASKIGSRARGELQALEKSGVLEQRRSGAGRRVHLVRRDALERYANKMYPNGFYADPTMDQSDRIGGIHAVRDSKRFRRDNAILLTVWARPGLAVISPQDDRLELGNWCTQAGCGSLVIEHGTIEKWKFEEKLNIIIVENKKNFLKISHLVPDADLAIYSDGRLSNLAIQWVSKLALTGSTITHYGDYDPVGLCEYERLYHACGDRVRLYVPENIEELFSKYSNAKLMKRRGSSRLMERLRRSINVEVRTVIALIDEYGAGLEQEVLLLALKGDARLGIK